LNQVLATKAELALARGEPEIAKPLVAQARAVLQAQYADKLLSSEAWRAAVLNSLEGGITLRGQDPTEREQLLLQALPVLKARFGSNGHYTEQTQLRLAQLYIATGRPALARPLVQRGSEK
jgi:hypothetical protein